MRLFFLFSFVSYLACASVSASPVADLSKFKGHVEVGSGKSWDPAKPGHDLVIKDEIRTGDDSSARILYRDEVRGAKASRVDLAPNSHVAIAQFELQLDHPGRRTTFLGMIKGAVRTFTKGWKGGSVFATKAGSVVCGVRGSEVLLTKDPEGETLVMLGGDVFKFHWDDDTHAMKVVSMLAGSSKNQGLPTGVASKVLGVDVTPLGENYAARVTEKDGVISIQEVTLSEEQMTALRAAIDGPDGFRADFRTVLGGIQSQLAQAKKQVVTTMSAKVRGEKSPYQQRLDNALRNLGRAIEKYEASGGGTSMGSGGSGQDGDDDSSETQKLARILAEAEGAIENFTNLPPEIQTKALEGLKAILVRVEELQAVIDSHEE